MWGEPRQGSMYKICNCPEFFLWPPKYDNIRIFAGRAGENRWGQQLRNSIFPLIKHESQLSTFTSKGELKPPIYNNGAFLCASERERRRGEKRKNIFYAYLVNISGSRSSNISNSCFLSNVHLLEEEFLFNIRKSNSNCKILYNCIGMT